MMLASKGSQLQRSLVSQANRSFGRTPMIQFLGPRSKTNKSVGAYASAAHGHGDSGAAAAQDESPRSAKALSQNCEVQFADIPADRWARMVISEQEMDIINQGTNDIDVDWKNIRL